MRKISQIILKNYKVLFRNKFSLFVLLLGPIILTFLIGFFYFNSNSFALNLGVYDPDNSEFNQFFLTQLHDSKFSVLEYDSKESCENSIKSGISHACIYLPDNYTLSQNSQNSIILKLDPSRGDIVQITQNLIINQLSQISSQIQIENTQKLLDIINQSENNIDMTTQNINKLTHLNENLKLVNKNIKSQTSDLDKLFDTKALGVSDLLSKYNGLNSTIQSLTKKGLDKTNSTENSVTEIRALFDTLNSSESELDDIENKVSTIDSNNDEIEKNFNSLKNSYYFRELSKVITNVDTKLNSAANSANTMSKTTSNSLDDNSKRIDNSTQILSLITANGQKYLEDIGKLESKNAKTLVTPVEVTIENIVVNSSVHLVSLFPSLIVGLIFIISLIMSSMFILTERKNQALFRNIMTNNSAFNFLIGDFLSLASLVFFQSLLIITLYHFWFLKSTDILLFLSLIAIVLPIISVFIFIGMLIGNLTKNESSNVILTFLVILGFLSLSGKILPLEALSQPVMNIAVNNPFLIAESMVRKFLLFGIGIKELTKELGLLGIYSVGLLFVSFILESFSKKRFLYGLYVQFSLKLKSLLSRAPEPIKQATLNDDKNNY